MFINPFNFVPLHHGKPELRVRKEGTYSGMIEYTLLTKTPLFIPNTSNEDAFCMNIDKHKSYDFFSYQDLSGKGSAALGHYEPVIPGSEIRGMLRSHFEILSNSCLSALDETGVLSKRTNETYKAGLLKRAADGSFGLVEATDCLMRTEGEDSLVDDWKDDREHWNRKCYKQSGLQEGERVRFRLVQRNGKQIKPLAMSVSKDGEDGTDEGYVLKGEDGPEMDGRKQRKHCCHIFAPKDTAKKEKLSAEELGTLDIVLKIYERNSEEGKTRYQEYARCLEKFKNGEGEDFFPVYFSTATESPAFFMLSPACITREVYRTKIQDMVSGHRACSNKQSLCPACALFGTLGEGFQVSSRVRMSDLHLEGSSKKMFEEDHAALYLDRITLAPLGTPRNSNLEFYVQRPGNAWFWTYDYYIGPDGKVRSYVPNINGRKFYWHQQEADTSQHEAGKMNTTIRPIKEGVMFSGRVYFDRLDKEELDMLLFTLQAGDDGSLAEKRHGYKLGHAKPLGYGSVAIHIDSITLRKYHADEATGWIQLHEEPYKQFAKPDIPGEILKNFKKMTDFQILGGRQAHYPLPAKPEEDGTYPVFKWFANNHKGYDRNKKRTVGMPNSRKQMVYVEYMHAMEPGLRKTAQPEKKPNGRVKMFADGKNFGFITLNGGGQDVFFHISNIGNYDGTPPKRGQDVYVETKSTEKGLSAKTCILL